MRKVLFRSLVVSSALSLTPCLTQEPSPFKPSDTKQGVDNFRFYGVIDEVLIARRAFAEQEIAAIYETGNNSR